MHLSNPALDGGVTYFKFFKITTNEHELVMSA